MKAKVTKSELRECVSGAFNRIMNEKRNEKENNFLDGKSGIKKPKYKKDGGNKGNHKFDYYNDEDMY